MRELRLEHVKVTCLPPALQDLSLIRCRLGPSPQLEAGTRLRLLHIASCTGQVLAAVTPHACMGACLRPSAPIMPLLMHNCGLFAACLRAQLASTVCALLGVKGCSRRRAVQDS